jgi:helix-turn-helix protein
MSVEAISWALNLAPVPADRGGQPSSACKFVLVGLANHAGPDGTAAFPSVVTLVRYTGLSERTVRTCLDRLAAEGIISPCDPGIVAARIKRADRRPQGWDLNLSLIRDDLTEADLAALGHHFPGLAARVAVVACPDAGGAADGLQPPHPARAADDQADGGSRCAPHLERGATSTLAGCSRRSHGVQQLHPNHPWNHPENRPPPVRVGARRCSQRRAPPSAPGGPGSSSRRSARPGG